MPPDFYLAAADELRRGMPDAALWSQVHVRASDETEARALYLSERSRHLKRAYAWSSRPTFSRVVDAVLFVSGCLLMSVGVFGVGAVLDQALRGWKTDFGSPEPLASGIVLAFLATFACAAAGGATLAWVGARTYWRSRPPVRRGGM